MKYIFLFLCLILYSCTSCVSPDDDSVFYFDEEKFMSEWNIWNDRGIKNYNFTLKGELPYWNYPAKATIMAIPMYDYEVLITVKNGIMDSFEYLSETPHKEGSNDSILEPEYTSISDMYQKVYDQIKNSELELPNYTNGCVISIRYEIKYNQEFHYITSFEPIYKIDSGCVWDTTVHKVIISDFTVAND